MTEMRDQRSVVSKRRKIIGICVKVFVSALLGLWMASCAELAWTQQPAAPKPGTYYSPETNLEALDVAALSSAQHSIAMAAFSLTDQAIINTLIDRAAHGVVVRIYLDRGELQAECRGDISCKRLPLSKLLTLPNVEIRVKHSKVLMHLKSYAVDTQGVIWDGSAHFSEQGERQQDNSAVFSLDPGAASAFGVKFRVMWARADNLTVAQAITGP